MRGHSISTMAIALAATFTVATFFIACDDDNGGADVTPARSATPATADGTPAGDTSPVAVTTAPAGPTTFHVLAGAEEGAVDIEHFMPATITIRQGDTIRWSGKGAEGHTVTFLADGRLDAFGTYLVPAADMPGAKEFSPAFTLASPQQGDHVPATFINSGYFGVPDEGEWSLRFPETGVFDYLCMIHPLTMRGTVVVEEPGAGVPSPETIEARAQAERAGIIEDSLAAQRQREEELRTAAERDAGGRAHTVAAGLDTPKSQVIAFVPASLQIDAGDTVTFSNSDRDFHNVVFAPPDYPVPPFPIIKPAEQGGFRLIINPDAEREVPPPPDFGPDDYFSSGIMGITFPRFTWTLTFNTPGTYRYQCTIHVLAGMSGVITVR